MHFGLIGSAQANCNKLAEGIGQGFHDYIDFNVEAEWGNFFSVPGMRRCPSVRHCAGAAPAR
jgi:hypothetical protein